MVDAGVETALAVTSGTALYIFSGARMLIISARTMRKLEMPRISRPQISESLPSQHHVLARYGENRRRIRNRNSIGLVGEWAELEDFQTATTGTALNEVIFERLQKAKSIYAQ